MTSLSNVLLPAGFLIHCLNVALASVVACAIAVVLSRRHTWSLPTRHALLVAALAASLLAPLIAPLLSLPSLWTIRCPDTVGLPKTAVASQPTYNIRQPDASASPVPASFSVTGTNSDPPPIYVPAVIVPDSVTSPPVPHAPIPEQPVSATTEWAWIIGSLLCGLWFVGIATGLVRATLSVARFRRWMQTVSVAESPLLVAAARGAADGVGVKNDVSVYCSNVLPAPITLGLIRPRIVVPAGIESILPFDQLRAVIQHEVAHIARRDLWIGLLQQVAQIGNWWNPLVRLANRQLADLREQICDDIAVRDLSEPDTYAATLINIAERCSLCMPVPTTLGIGPSPARQLENRIRRIVSSPKVRCVRLSRTAAVGVSAVTALMAATILLAQVQIDSPPVLRSTENIAMNPVATNPVEQPSDRPETVEAPQPAQAEKPLTLDELRPLVVDQIRSIRSLYVAYSLTDPTEFGGKSHEHVWAEQGFKLLKFDMPGSARVPYASTFDGKQTYVGGFQGDKAVRGDVRNELIPNFHQTLQSTLLGWLHFGGQRESIADVIRAPTATLVEAAVADDAPGTTIEIKNYSQPANKSLLDVTIVLDRAHSYLPKSITYHSVTNPSWQFAYEVDEFRKVRDGATGEDRWFPSRGRYKQRTPEHGEQIFTTTIRKLQINDSLPDELFVLPADSPSAAPGQEQQVLAEFEKVYRLEPGQLVKRINRPFLPGRMVNLKKWYADHFAAAPYETMGTFLPMVYPERDGKLERPNFHFTGGVGRTGTPAGELVNSVVTALTIRWRDIDDPDKLLEPMVEGEFVIRADAPPEKVIAALGDLLKRDCSVPAKLELRDVEHPVIDVSGKITAPFVIEPATVVELYVTEPQPRQGEIEQGTFAEFLQAVARYIDPQRRIINQVENSPYRQEKISWHRTPDTEKNDKAILGETEARAVLDHLEKQTGLKFTLEPRKFPTIFVRRSE